MIRRPPRSTLFPLHDALPISARPAADDERASFGGLPSTAPSWTSTPSPSVTPSWMTTCARSAEHTFELQSRQYLVCRLLLEKTTRRGIQIGNTHILTQHPYLV